LEALLTGIRDDHTVEGISMARMLFLKLGSAIKPPLTESMLKLPPFFTTSFAQVAKNYCVSAM
jgi:hypothetical protein